MNVKVWAKIALFAAAIIWGISFVVLKDAINVLPPVTTIGIRFTIAFALLSVLFCKKYKKINRDYIVHGIIAGIFLGLAYGVQTIGLEYTTPGKNAFLTAGYCVITPFLYWALSGKRPTVYNITAAFVCIVGFGFVSLDGDLSISKGDLLTIICGFFYALHISYVAKVYGDKDPMLFSIVQFGAAAVLTLVYGFIFETMPEIVPLSVVPNILFLAVFATAMGMLFQSIGQKYTNPSAASLILSLESVFGVIFSLILYEDEKMTLKLFIGFALIFIAIMISEVIGGEKQNEQNKQNEGV